jgi:hypothetical protein
MWGIGQTPVDEGICGQQVAKFIGHRRDWNPDHRQESQAQDNDQQTHAEYASDLMPRKTAASSLDPAKKCIAEIRPEPGDEYRQSRTYDQQNKENIENVSPDNLPPADSLLKFPAAPTIFP